MTTTPKPLVYLACPYSHPDRAVRVARFEAANRMAAKLMNDGLMVFSPLSGSHPISEQCELPGHWEFWQAYDTAFISCCWKLFVLCIDGWQESVGVRAEIAIAEGMGIEVEYLEATK